VLNTVCVLVSVSLSRGFRFSDLVNSESVSLSLLLAAARVRGKTKSSLATQN